MLDGLVALLVLLYLCWRWADANGILRPMIVVLPFATHGEAEAAMASGLAAALQGRINRVRDLFSVDHQEAVAARLARNVGLGDIIALPSVRTFESAAEAISIKPIEIGPVKLSATQFLFELLPKRATVLSGTYERIGTTVRLTVDDKGSIPYVVEDTASAKLPQMVDTLAYQLIATRWIPASAKASWPAVKHLTEGLETYSALINAGDTGELKTAVASLQSAIKAAPSWPVPKLYLGWLLYVENQNKAAAEAVATLLEAIDLFDDVAYNSPSADTRLLGRIAAVHVYAHVVRSNPAQCNHTFSIVDGLVRHLDKLRSDTAHADLPWRVQLALGNGDAALAQLLSNPGCTRAVKRMQELGQRIEPVAYIDEALARFEQVIADPGVDTSAANTARYNLGIARYLKAEHLLKVGRPAADVTSEIAAARAALVPLGFPADRPFLRSTLAHMSLLEAAAQQSTSPPPQQRARARAATDQLRNMSFEQRGFPVDWARARMVDTLIGEGDWVAAVRLLHELIDNENVAEPARRKSPWWTRPVVDPNSRALSSNPESSLAADRGVLHVPANLQAHVVPRLRAIANRNQFGIISLLGELSAQLDRPAADLVAADALVEAIDKRRSDHKHLWSPLQLEALQLALEARLAAARGDHASGRSKLDQVARHLTSTPSAAGKYAITIEAIRASHAISDGARAKALAQDLPQDLRFLLPTPN